MTVGRSLGRVARFVVSWLLVDGLDGLGGGVDVSLLGLSVDSGLRSVDREMGSRSLDTKMRVGAFSVSLSLRAVEVDMGGGIGLLDLSSVIRGLRSLGLSLTLMEGEVRSSEIEFRAEGLNVRSDELVAELRSTESEVTSLGSVTESSLLDAESGLRSIDTKLGAWSFNLVVDGVASVAERSVRAVRLLAAISFTIGGIVGESLSTISTVGEVTAVGEIVRSDTRAIGELLSVSTTEGGSVSGVSKSLSADSSGESSTGGANTTISELGARVSTGLGSVVSLSANASRELFAGGANIGSVVSIEATTSVKRSSREAAGMTVATLAVTDSDFVVVRFDISSLVLEVELLVDITLSLEVSGLVLEISTDIDVVFVLEITSLVLGLTSELEVSGWGLKGSVVTVSSVAISLLLTVVLGGGSCGNDSSSDSGVHMICFLLLV